MDREKLTGLQGPVSTELAGFVKYKGQWLLISFSYPIKAAISGEELVKDLIWDNALSVQVQEIDEDHRRLVDLFNILNHSVVEGDATNYIEAVMEELISCTIWHEERLMLKYGYKGFVEHKTEHQELIESARAMQ